MTHDLRTGFRLFSRAPAFALTAVLTLGIGIGANTAMFSVVDRVLINTVPFTEPDRLMVIWNRSKAQAQDALPLAPGDVVDYQALNRSFEALGASRTVTLPLTGTDEPEELPMARVTASVFKVLRVNPAAGRTFSAEEDRPGGPALAVISARLARRLFQNERAALGRVLSIGTQPHEVIGVMPDMFQYPTRLSEVWLPLGFGTSEVRLGHNYNGLGRLKPGVTVEQAQSDLQGIARDLAVRFPESNRDMDVYIESLQRTMTGTIRPALLILMGAVGLVLIIACANVASLLLARASARQREVALRLALGANRAAIVRLFLLESLPLALAGGIVGLAFTTVSLGIMRRVMPPNVPGAPEIGINADVLMFTLLLSIGTCVLVALVPALRASKPDVSQQLKDSARTTGDRAGLRIRNLFVIGEVALATVLLIGAGLLIESFRRVIQTDAGFKTEGVATMRIALPRTVYKEPERIAAFYRDVLTRVQSTPGVKHAGLINRLPLSGQGSSGPLTIERPGSMEPIRDIAWRATSAHYFRAMGIPVLRGREFLDSDVAGQPGVIIVDDLMARAFWPNDDPIGKRVKLGLPEWADPWLTVVGVVRNVHHSSLDSEPPMQVYWPYAQRPELTMVLVAQTTGDPQPMLATLRAQVFAVDGNQPVSAVATMDTVLAESLVSRRFTMLLLGLFAGLALVLAALGIYGLMAYIVSLRTREIGIRMALGATRADVLRIIMREVLVLTVIGLLIGLVGAAFTRDLLTSLLYGVSATDPGVTGLVVGLLLIVATAGGLVPALRAARTPTVVALRTE